MLSIHEWPGSFHELRDEDAKVGRCTASSTGFALAIQERGCLQWTEVQRASCLAAMLCARHCDRSGICTFDVDPCPGWSERRWSAKSVKRKDEGDAGSSRSAEKITTCTCRVASPRLRLCTPFAVRRITHNAFALGISHASQKAAYCGLWRTTSSASRLETRRNRAASQAG